MMGNYTALLDANVLYPAPMRDLLLQLAATDLFRAKWTDDIQNEWINALLRNDPARDSATLERTRDLMNQAVPDCLITGYEAFIPEQTLPDENDRHVLAAAVVGRCDVIVTQNLKHFPGSILEKYGIVAEHPDEFLSNHLHLAPGVFCNAARKVRARLKRPPFTIQEYLDMLTRQGLVATAAELATFAELI